MAKAPTFVGIDLGTTYSAVAYLNNHGKVEIIPNERSQPVTPSVVMFPEGNDEEPIVGERARRMARFSPDRVIECVKRHIGDATVEYEVSGETYTPEEISAVILRELRNIGQLHLSREVTEAVITVPAYFDDERNATKLAGELAGFRVLGILNEPTAAALAFGLDHAVEKGIALIYDLGGGTFDVSVVELDGGNIRVLATDGVRLLGGVDWDSKLLEYAAHEFMVKHGPDPREDLRSMQRLADEVEAAKRSLSSHSRAKLFLECGDVAGQVLITREKFEDLTEGLLLQTEAYTEAVLEKAELEWSDIDRILLAGGSTRMPMVRNMLKELSGMEPDTSLNPDECVAIGACYYATKLKSDASIGAEMSTVGDALRQVANSITVENVASHSIGIQSVIQGQRQNVVMIPEQTPLPHEVTRYFATHADNQVTVEVKVLEGDSDDPEDCNLLGNAVIKGLPANRKRGSKISVTYVYSDEGILTVKAQDVESGQNCEATIKRGASDAPEYVQAMRERLDALYMLEGETADEVATREREEEEARELDPPEPIDYGEEYDDHADIEDSVSTVEEPEISTGHMRRIQSDLSSIADSSEDLIATDPDEYGEAVANIGGELADDASTDPVDFDESIYDEEPPYPVDPNQVDAPIESREATPGDYVDPWQMAADQGLLDGEVLAATDDTAAYDETLAPADEAPNPYASETDMADTQQGYYEDSEAESLAVGSGAHHLGTGDHFEEQHHATQRLDDDDSIEPEGYRMSDDLDQAFGSYDPPYGDPEDTYESEMEPEGYREATEEEPHYETMKDGVPKSVLGEGEVLDKSDYEE
ncbi:MAG: Hsp70 family protein [Planctomycetota bacterium]|nr:Hsp70 family protein [Planctomycetota bacterium]